MFFDLFYSSINFILVRVVLIEKKRGKLELLLYPFQLINHDSFVNVEFIQNLWNGEFCG